MSFSWLSRLNCAPLQKALFMQRLHFIARNFDTLYAASAQDRPPALDKISVFIALDPDLAALYKGLKDAEARYDQVKALYDIGDPMIDMALWQMESCQSAFDTRLIEVEADAETAARAREIREGKAELPRNTATPVVYIDKNFNRPAQANGLIMIFVLMLIFGIFPFNRTPVFRPAVA